MKNAFFQIFLLLLNVCACGSNTTNTAQAQNSPTLNPSPKTKNDPTPDIKDQNLHCSFTSHQSKALRGEIIETQDEQVIPFNSQLKNFNLFPQANQSGMQHQGSITLHENNYELNFTPSVPSSFIPQIRLQVNPHAKSEISMSPSPEIQFQGGCATVKENPVKTFFSSVEINCSGDRINGRENESFKVSSQVLLGNSELKTLLFDDPRFQKKWYLKISNATRDPMLRFAELSVEQNLDSGISENDHHSWKASTSLSNSRHLNEFEFSAQYALPSAHRAPMLKYLFSAHCSLKLL